MAIVDDLQGFCFLGGGSEVIFDDFWAGSGIWGGSESAVSIESMKCPPFISVTSIVDRAFHRPSQKSAGFPLAGWSILETAGNI